MMTASQNKTKDKDFIEQLKNFDIVLLIETHVGYNTVISIHGFHYYPLCREKSSNNRFFGGLDILIKKNIRKGVALLQNSNTEYQWLKLKKDFLVILRMTFFFYVYLILPLSLLNIITDLIIIY